MNHLKIRKEWVGALARHQNLSKLINPQNVSVKEIETNAYIASKRSNTFSISLHHK